MRRRALLAQTRAETTLQLRRGENLVVTLAIPLGILVFFAKVDTISTDLPAVDFLVSGVLSLSSGLHSWLRSVRMERRTSRPRGR